jgi:hypothetical protein
MTLIFEFDCAPLILITDKHYNGIYALELLHSDLLILIGFMNLFEFFSARLCHILVIIPVNDTSFKLLVKLYFTARSRIRSCDSSFDRSR